MYARQPKGRKPMIGMVHLEALREARDERLAKEGRFLTSVATYRVVQNPGELQVYFRSHNEEEMQIPASDIIARYNTKVTRSPSVYGKKDLKTLGRLADAVGFVRKPLS